MNHHPHPRHHTHHHNHNAFCYVAGEEVIQTGNGPSMGRCNHEEADTRLVVHLRHALRHFSLALVQTGDTDVIVIMLCNFHHILATNDAAQVWISFQAGTTKRMINLNDLAETLGSIKCKALALFHAFTGSDIVPLLSSLKGNGSATRHLRNCRPSWINFGNAFLVLESRGGNLTEFFRHESAIYPPALSSRGKMNSCTKSDLLNCILDADTTSNCRPSWINFLLLQARSSKHPHRFVKQHKISYVRCMTVMACLQPDNAATTTLIL